MSPTWAERHCLEYNSTFRENSHKSQTAGPRRPEKAVSVAGRECRCPDREPCRMGLPSAGRFRNEAGWSRTDEIRANGTRIPTEISPSGTSDDGSQFSPSPSLCLLVTEPAAGGTTRVRS